MSRVTAGFSQTLGLPLLFWRASRFEHFRGQLVGVENFKVGRHMGKQNWIVHLDSSTSLRVRDCMYLHN